MIERWYKAPVSCLFDVRVARMPAGLFKAWHQLLALASLNDGALPPVEQMAFTLRASAATVLKRLEALAERGLTILHDGLWRLRDAMAPKETDDADAPLTGAERTRRWRERRSAPEAGDAGGDGSVTSGDEHREEEKKEDFPRDVTPRPAQFKRAPVATTTWIAIDTPEWDAWAAHWRSSKGLSPPTDKRGGWNFPSRWPPTIASRVAAE